LFSIVAFKTLTFHKVL